MIQKYLSLVKFSHTIFALPFALIGYALGVADYEFSWFTLLGVIVCMVLARSAAMGFNRLVDRKYDAANPRTANREIPAGKISPKEATWFVVLCSIGFIAVAATFNKLTLLLSPVALAVILVYSLTKRFTALCHIVLGMGLAIAPMAAYIAVTGSIDITVVVISVAVLTWVSGFDIIFALQDTNFDRSAGLKSIPAKLGIKGGLIVSAVLHLLTFVAVIIVATLLIESGSQELLVWLGTMIFTLLLIYQHLIVRPNDLNRINIAFGTTNGIASVIYATFVISSVVFGQIL